MSRLLQAAALTGYDGEIGRWLWALEEVRNRTLDAVRDLDQEALDWEGPSGSENAIGSLLYHIAAVELAWLFMDVLLRDMPSSLKQAFPHPMATDGRITRVLGVGLDEHLERLERSRATLLEEFRGMSIEDWNRVRSPDDVDYEVTPAWAVFHLIEHEAGHTAQIGALKARASARWRKELPTMVTEPDTGAEETHWARPVVQVDDLEASVAYYRDRLGFVVDWMDDSGEVPACGQVSRHGVTLILNRNASFPRASVPSVVSLTLDDSPATPRLESLHEELVRLGGRVARPPFKVRWDPRVRQMDVEDLDGNVLMFWGHVLGEPSSE